MKDKIIKELNELEDFLTEKADVNLEDYQNIIKHTQAIRGFVLTIYQSSLQLNIGFVKGQEVLYNFFDYKILAIRYPKVYLKPLDDNNPYIETTIDTITAKNI